MKILLIEDDYLIGDGIVAGFKKLGFNDYIQDKMWEEFCLFVDKYC